MSLALFLPWFPIVLAVGVGGRLLGRSRGFAFGSLCGLFWIILVQSSAGLGMWSDGWVAASVVFGMLAIVAMGGWAGESARTNAGGEAGGGILMGLPRSGGVDEDEGLRLISESMARFDDWMAGHHGDPDPWSSFDELIRSEMFAICQATHVRPMRLMSGTDELVPLRDTDPVDESGRMSGRMGIVGHVVTTGRSYLANDPRQGELLNQLAGSSDPPSAWCFGISHRGRRAGVVLVGQLNIDPDRHRWRLRAVERLVELYWGLLNESLVSRSAATTDPASGVLTREAFIHASDDVLRLAYANGEPVAVAVLALERIRELNDAGDWDLADQLIREVSQILRRKTRLDDRLGRFDGSRFVVLLRRVDSDLAALIVEQLMARLVGICGDAGRWNGPVTVRCGLVGSGSETPPLRTLMAGALKHCNRARMEGLLVASDLQTPVVPAGASA